jgi:hypothetical protein
MASPDGRDLAMPYKIAPALMRAWLVLLCAAGLWGGSTPAADSTEFWPELGAFVDTSPRTRLFFDVPCSGDANFYNQTLETAAYVDITLEPIWRPSLRQADWQGSKFLWVRVGYDHILSASNGTKKEPEDRLIFELRGRVELPDKWLIEGRARSDFRWIGGDYSNRYRFRIEVNRECTVLDHTVTPYLQVEWFYDTRYDGWSRILYQLGPEITVGKHFRYEVYVARQVDRLPTYSALNAAGLFFKWYF